MSALGESSLTAGRAALVRAAWAEARSRYQAALEDGETVEALEGLGVAARWQMDGPTALAAHERAYGLARESDDEPASARLAIELAFDCAQFRGAAETNGWLERAGTCWRPPSVPGACDARLLAREPRAQRRARSGRGAATRGGSASRPPSQRGHSTTR